MADVFAVVNDLKDRWPDFPPGGEKHAEVLLADATDFILAEVPEAVNAPEATLRRVTCSVVRRAMQAGMEALSGVASYTESTGPFSETYRPVNPNGDFYLTRAEKRSLGARSQVAFGANVAGCGQTPHGQACALNFGATYCDCGLALFGEVRSGGF